jgi:hypothetical protein
MMETPTTRSSAAVAFEQRSAAAVAQVAAAYDDGPFSTDTDSTPTSTSPISVSPLSSSSSPSSALERLEKMDFKAAQIEQDAKLAQELQREEYRRAEAASERRRQRQEANANTTNNQDITSSWSDWIMGTNTATSLSSSSSPLSTTTSSSSPLSSQGGGGGGGARIAAPSSSIFECVAQSISTAINPKTEVSGVDSTSLL